MPTEGRNPFPGPEAGTPARAYVERAERQAVLFPLRFTAGNGATVQGTCENLSESGLLATFARPMEIWTHGTVDLLFGTGLLGVAVWVARADGLRAGFAFQGMDREQRRKIRELMEEARTAGFLPDHL